MKFDPVCGMRVDPKTAAASTVYAGETYYFCSQGCKAGFEKDPEKYLESDKTHDDHGHHGHH